MREIISPVRDSKHTKVICEDRPGPGGACHSYRITDKLDENDGSFADIKFQKGPVQESGVNGCHQEDLLLIVRDRLVHFQAGEYSCRENAIALTKIEEALHWLNARTLGRERRGVEGTSER